MVHLQIHLEKYLTLTSLGCGTPPNTLREFLTALYMYFWCTLIICLPPSMSGYSPIEPNLYSVPHPSYGKCNRLQHSCFGKCRVRWTTWAKVRNTYCFGMVNPLPILLGNVPGKCIRVNVVMDLRTFHDIKGPVVADSTSEKNNLMFNRDFGHYFECMIIIKDCVTRCGQENDIICHTKP